MLRQSSHALLVFTKVLWPDFSFLDFASAILRYQRSYTSLQAGRRISLAAREMALARTNQGDGEHIAFERARTFDDPNVDDIRGVLGQLSRLKVKTDRMSGSPNGIATPGAISSPSSKSDGSEECIDASGQHQTPLPPGLKRR